MRHGFWIASIALATLGMTGCEDTNYQDYDKAPLSEGHEAHHDHGHAGKYDGHVLELDDTHSYHAELLMDGATRDVTVYFYGSEIGVAKVASNVTLELHDGDAHKEFSSTPMPLEGETDETASRWVFLGTDFPAAVKSEEQLDGHLNATIDGKSLSASLEPHSHDHGHAEHAEGGHDEDGHEEHGDAAHPEGDHDHDAKGKAEHDEHDHADPKAK